MVGKAHKKWVGRPKTAHETMTEFKQLETVNYHFVPIDLFIAVMILGFGAGVGPEAVLLSTIISLSIWQADKLRYIYFNNDHFEQSSIIKKIEQLLHPTKYLMKYNKDHAVMDLKLVKKKKRFYNLFIINGILMFMALMRTTNQPSFVTILGASNWWGKELLLILPLIIFSLFYGKAYELIALLFQKISDILGNQVITKALIGGLAIFLVGIFFPNLLFSGQHSLYLIPKFGATYNSFQLSFFAIIKLIFLQICLKTGWIGGDIFPVVFASMLQGFAIAQFFPQQDTLFIVAVVSVSLSISILKSPWLAGIFTSLFFPLKLFPVTLLVTLLFVIGSKLKLKLNKKMV